MPATSLPNSKMIAPIRGSNGRIRVDERPRVPREVCNPDRRMFLVQFEGRATTFLFPNEVVLSQPDNLRGDRRDSDRTIQYRDCVVRRQEIRTRCDSFWSAM